MNHTTNAAAGLDKMIGVLLGAAQRDPEIGAALRWIGERLMGAGTPADSPAAAPADAPATDEPAIATKVVQKTLAIGDGFVTMEVPDTGVPVPMTPKATASPFLEYAVARDAPSMVPPDLQRVVERCGVKAESCRWALERRMRLANGDDFESFIKPTDQELLSRARALPNCRAWMLDPFGPQAEDSDLSMIADWYDTLAYAADTARQYVQHDDPGTETDPALIQLIATAQSALRCVLECAVDIVDHDQTEMFAWLRAITRREEILIQRHMRRDDPADPADWSTHRADLDAWIEARERVETGERTRRQLISRIRYHIDRLIGGSDNAEHDWTRVVETCAEWVESGAPPTNKALCAEVARLEEIEAPETVDVPDKAVLVLEATDHFIALRQRSTEPVTAKERRQPKHVEQARTLLEGGVMVLIGGDVRPHTQRALERDLGLAEVRWCETRAGMPLDRVESEIHRDDVTVVVLAIRWSSHIYGSFAEVCKQIDVPFVRLKAGYNSSQVARHVLDQAGDRLAERRRTALVGAEAYD